MVARPRPLAHLRLQPEPHSHPSTQSPIRLCQILYSSLLDGRIGDVAQIGHQVFHQMLHLRLAHGAISLPSLGEVVRLLDLLSNQVPLNMGAVGRALRQSRGWPSLAAGPIVHRSLEHLGLHGSIALVIGHGRRQSVCVNAY